MAAITWHEGDEDRAAMWVMTNDDGEEIGREVDTTSSVARASEVLTIARRISTSVVAILDDPGAAGWTVLYDRLPTDASARSWHNSYAEVQS